MVGPWDQIHKTLNIDLRRKVLRNKIVVKKKVKQSCYSSKRLLEMLLHIFSLSKKLKINFIGNVLNSKIATKTNVKKQLNMFISHKRNLKVSVLIILNPCFRTVINMLT